MKIAGNRSSSTENLKNKSKRKATKKAPPKYDRDLMKDFDAVADHGVVSKLMWAKDLHPGAADRPPRRDGR